MKALLLLCIGFFLTLSSVQAQDTMLYGKKLRLHRNDAIYTVEYVTMYQGHLHHSFRRQVRDVDRAFILKDGTEIHPDGTYRTPAGLVYNLREGEYMDMEGNRYASLSNFNLRKKMTEKDMDRIQHKQYR